MINRADALDRLNKYEQPYLGLSELSEIVGISKGTAHGRMKRNKLPEPMVKLAMGPVWTKESIWDWLSDIRINQIVTKRKEQW
ncbi:MULTISPECIES: hypothetical protein [unclassified Bradyrhizobium]|uniref:hypothetical protein n=1 Tax=unclassified Bradyrhizobium TaxID=2631580 RepID=UPI0033912F90